MRPVEKEARGWRGERGDRVGWLDECVGCVQGPRVTAKGGREGMQVQQQERHGLAD